MLAWTVCTHTTLEISTTKPKGDSRGDGIVYIRTKYGSMWTGFSLPPVPFDNPHSQNY